MQITRNAFAVVAFVVAAWGAALPGMAQLEECPKQSATGHIEVIGSQTANFGRHIIYSFSAIQSGEQDELGKCLVNGQIEEFLYARDPGGDLSKHGDLLRRSHGDVVCIGVFDEPQPPRPGQPPLIGIAHMAARITDFYPPPSQPPPAPVYWIWKVQDNGEGAHDAPDYGSALMGVPEGTAYAFCLGGDQRLMGPSIKGNVQIRPPPVP
jgi:hypothetical protein